MTEEAKEPEGKRKKRKYTIDPNKPKTKKKIEEERVKRKYTKNPPPKTGALTGEPNFIRRKVITSKVAYKFRDTVVGMAKLGCTNKEICAIVGMSLSTLIEKFRDELDEGRGNLRASIRRSQIELAIKEKNPTMLIWLGKIYLQQKEPKQDIEHSGNFNIEKVLFADAVKKEIEYTDEKD